MEKTRPSARKYGLIGRNISYSFSRGYFRDKFRKLSLEHCDYVNFDLQDIREITTVLDEHKDLAGLNVTIPYKEAVIPYLNALDPVAEKIGAVNTIKFTPDGPMGYNTDAHGFEQALLPHLKPHHRGALILGTGGASKAIAYVFDKLKIPHKYVSRNPSAKQLAYGDITADVLEAHPIVVNCTPLGTWPEVAAKPHLPYDLLGPKQLLFDLIYNPKKTAFLLEGEQRGADISNGLKMLELQAEKAWEIWNS